MSESPVLSKMDALLKKHRGGSELQSDALPGQTASPESPPPSNAWLPVLTHVIERGNPPATAAAMPVKATPPARPPVTAPATAIPAAGKDALTEQLMNELAPRLAKVMEQQVAAELRKNLDETVATLLNQLDLSVREIVREAVTEKLKPPRDPST